MRAKKPLEREDISTKIRPERLPLPRNLDRPQKSQPNGKDSKQLKKNKPERNAESNKPKIKSKAGVKGKVKKDKKTK